MPILFEGGAGGDVSDWGSFPDTLAKITQATLITYDRAGFGKSELDTSNHDLNKHGILQGMEALETGLKKLGYTGNIMLIAHSYGGFYATLYAARHPATVKAAVLIDANHVCWFQDTYVDSVTQLRTKAWANEKKINWPEYYMGMNLPITVALMRKTPFPATIPAIDLVSEKNFPDSTWSARWADCHRQFAAAQPNRTGITAYGCGHFIFRDNLLLAVSAVVKAYVGAVNKEQGYDIMKRFLSYSLAAANDERRKEAPTRH